MASYKLFLNLFLISSIGISIHAQSDNDCEQFVIENNSNIHYITHITRDGKRPFSTLLKSCAMVLGAAGLYRGENYIEKACGALLCSLASISLMSNILNEQQEKNIKKPWQKYFEKIRTTASGVLLVGTLGAMISSLCDHATDIYDSLPHLRSNAYQGKCGALAAFLGLYYLLYKGVFIGIPAVSESIQEDLLGQSNTQRSLNSIVVNRSQDGSFCAVDFRSPAYQVSFDHETREDIIDTICG